MAAPAAVRAAAVERRRRRRPGKAGRGPRALQLPQLSHASIIQPRDQQAAAQSAPDGSAGPRGPRQRPLTRTPAPFAAPIFFQFLAPYCATMRRSSSSCRAEPRSARPGRQLSLQPGGGGVDTAAAMQPAARQLPGAWRKFGPPDTNLLLAPSSPPIASHLGLHVAAAARRRGRACLAARSSWPGSPIGAMAGSIRCICSSTHPSSGGASAT